MTSVTEVGQAEPPFRCVPVPAPCALLLAPSHPAQWRTSADQACRALDTVWRATSSPSGTDLCSKDDSRCGARVRRAELQAGRRVRCDAASLGAWRAQTCGSAAAAATPSCSPSHGMVQPLAFAPVQWWRHWTRQRVCAAGDELQRKGREGGTRKCNKQRTKEAQPPVWRWNVSQARGTEQDYRGHVREKNPAWAARFVASDMSAVWPSHY